MTSRPNVPAICPSASSIIRSAASHPPGPLGRVPRPHRYYQPTPTSRPPSRVTSFPSLSTTTASPAFAPPGAGQLPEGLDHFYRGARAASARWRRRDIPGSWTTLAYMPRSSTPADRRTQATTGPAMWSSANLTTSTPHGTLSRLYHAACTLSVYASQPGSPPDHATLDSGWWPALTGQGSHLLGRVEGFRHVYPSTWLSPSPSFAWRNKSLFLHPAISPRNTLEMCEFRHASGATPSGHGTAAFPMPSRAENSGLCATPISNRTFATPYVSRPFLSHARSVTHGISLNFLERRFEMVIDTPPITVTIASTDRCGRVRWSSVRWSSVRWLLPSCGG